MTELNPIHTTTSLRVGAAAAAAAGRSVHQTEAPAIRRGVDRVEVSEVATYLNKLKQLPAVRQDLVDSVRSQIAAGTYDTAEKLDAAIDEMLNDI